MPERLPFLFVAFVEGTGKLDGFDLGDAVADEEEETAEEARTTGCCGLARFSLPRVDGGAVGS
jgi:hypothetical protein